MKKQIKKLLTLIILVGFISSCQKDDNINSSITSYKYGYYITNEGNFGTGNGSLSYIFDDGTVSNNIYQNANNGSLLGDVVQSMQIIKNHAYIVVNNSNRVVVASKESMVHVAEISIIQPRYISQVSNNKAYVTSWGNNSVEVIDLSTNTVINSILCGVGPESITVSNGLAYVTNIGGWGFDNTVTVIDIASDMVVSTINVGDKPNSAQVDASGNIWVLCGGYTEYDPNTWAVISQTQAELIKISNGTVIMNFAFNIGESPKNLVVNDAGTMLYYLSSGDVYSFNENLNRLSDTPIISENFYGLLYHNGYLMGTDAVDYVQSGFSKMYSLDGNLIKSNNVGIIPNGYCYD